MFVPKIFVLCLLVCCVHAHKWKCDKADEKEVDDVVSFLFTLGRKDRKFPVNNNEMKEYCKDQKKYLAKLESYKDQCLKERQKQIVAVVVYSMKTIINNYCRNLKGKRTQELLQSATCANKNLNTYHVCNINLINLLIDVRALKPEQNKEKLEQLCCGYIDALNCIKTTASNSGCPPKHIDTNMDFIRSYFDGAVNTLCGDYTEHNDKCDKITRIKIKEHKDRPQSVFKPVTDILLAL